MLPYLSGRNPCKTTGITNSQMCKPQIIADISHMIEPVHEEMDPPFTRLFIV